MSRTSATVRSVSESVEAQDEAPNVPPQNDHIDNKRGEVTVTIATARKIAQALGMTLAGLFTELED